MNKLIDLWSKDSELQNGVPYRRMATEAMNFVLNKIKPAISDADFHECCIELNAPCSCEYCRENINAVNTLEMARYIIKDDTYMDHAGIEFIAVLKEDIDNGKTSFDEHEGKIISRIYKHVSNKSI